MCKWLITLIIPFSLMAQMPTTQSQMPPASPRPSTGQTAQQPGGNEPALNKPKPFTPAPIHVAPIVQNPENQTPDSGRTEIYTEPGITGVRDGKWVGSDNLFNLSPDLGLAVDIIAPVGKTIPLDKEEIVSSVTNIFSKSNITPHTTFSSRKAPTPFFNIIIMVYPVPQGYVAFVSTRLFEDAILQRTDLGNGINWQVITWERETLIVAGSDDLKNAIQKSVTELSQEFVDRFKHFESLAN